LAAAFLPENALKSCDPRPDLAAPARQACWCDRLGGLAMERMTMIAVGGMTVLAVIGAMMVPPGATPVGPASAAMLKHAPVQLSETERTVEAG
jgi:hypothetical protein